MQNNRSCQADRLFRGRFDNGKIHLMARSQQVPQILGVVIERPFDGIVTSLRHANLRFMLILEAANPDCCN